jgi:xylulokinase
VPLYLGLDSSTQSLTAIVLDVERDACRIVFESSLSFDETLPRYGTRHGVLPHADPAVAQSSPVMWAEALDVMLARVARGGLDMSRLAAVSGSAQQHGSVYMKAGAAAWMRDVDPKRPPPDWLPPILSRAVAPIWMDASTAAECAELTRGVGGSDRLANTTGSRAFERFTGPQIRKVFKQEPDAYANTDRIHLVSSFLASLLVGAHVPIDPGDGSGMNLMALATSDWWPAALEACAPDLHARLPPIRPSSSVAGSLSPYWQRRYGLPPASVILWTGDNPSTLVGAGLVREGIAAVSLGTSDTVFGLMGEPRVDATGTGHVFGAPTGAFMGLTCFSNGSLARERVRDMFGLTWDRFADVLDRTPPGNRGRVLLPWFEPEITPTVSAPGLRRYGPFENDVAADAAAHVRGVVEAQMMALALHAQWMGVDIRTIHATGGAATSRAILRVMADVFGADVYQFDVGNTACLGAALRARHGHETSQGRACSWDDVVRGIASPVAASRIQPDPARHAIYRDLLPVYAACEAHALGRGPDPAGLLVRFASAFREGRSADGR